MATIQDHIDLVLETIQGLLGQIEKLSKRAVAIEVGIAEALQAYNEKLGMLNSKADELKRQAASLGYELNPNQGHIEPKPIARETENQQKHSPLQPKPEETMAETPLQKGVNAMVADRRRDVGDILEILPWGPIWRLRTDGETLEEQLKRLNGWQDALEGRLAFWQGEVLRLESDKSYDLWQEMQTSSPERWLIYLDELASSQTAENARLEHAVAVLERELQARKRGEVLDD